MGKKNGVVVLAPEEDGENAFRTDQALKLHLEGQSYEEVGQRLNVSAWTARELISVAYQRLATETADELRAAEELRLNDLTKKLNDDLRVAPDQATRNGVYSLLLKVSAERSRLLGLHLPPEKAAPYA